VVDGSQACFLLITESGFIRVIMSLSQFHETINNLTAVLPTNIAFTENVEIKAGRLYETSVKAVDIRAGVLTSVGKKIPELRLYTGKKRKHYVRLILSWSHLRQIVDAMSAMVVAQTT